MYRNVFILILLFTLLGMVGCADNATDTLPDRVEEMVVYTPPVQGAVSHLSFQTGDRIGIYPVSYRNGVAGTLGDVSNPMNVCYTYTSRGWEAKPGDEIFLDDVPMDIYAFYPYDPEMSRAEGKLNLTAYPFDVSGNQAEKENDFLWAKAFSVSKQSPVVGFQFYHLMSKITINLKRADTTGHTVPDLSLHNIKTSCSINLRTGAVTANDQPGIIIPALEPEPTTGYDQTFEALLPPQAMASGTPLFIIEYPGEQWVYCLPKEVVFSLLNNYTFNLTIGGQASRTGKNRQTVSPIITQR